MVSHAGEAQLGPTIFGQILTNKTKARVHATPYAWTAIPLADAAEAHGPRSPR